MTYEQTIQASSKIPAGLYSRAETKAGPEVSFESEQPETVSYDVTRQALSISEAAALLGKTVPALERAVQGRWGNKLPEGWTAQKNPSGQWQIVPPAAFKIRQTVTQEVPADTWSTVVAGRDGGGTSTRMVRRERTSHDQPTIVIDRSEDVENLLRELLVVQKALSEERRMHMDDMRMITQLQGSMRLLETNAQEKSKLEADLERTRAELASMQKEFNEYAELPFWKRIFISLKKRG